MRGRAERRGARAALAGRTARTGGALLPQRLNGGEGDMLVGKALWAYHHKRRT